MPQMFIEEKDDCVYNFNDFELCLSNSGHYILCSQGYFEFKTLGDFIKTKDGFRIVDEEGLFYAISESDFKEIEKLYNNY